MVICFMQLVAQGAASSLQSGKFLAAKNVLTTQMDTPDQEQLLKEDPVKAQVAKWSGHSAVPHVITTMIGAVWVLMLGSTPILVYKLDNRDLTVTGLVLAIMMWVALFGGLVLFTNIIMFESPHFDEVRPLTIIECTYFMTQIITTVGYGDITPAKRRGQIFVGLYLLFAFFVIALLVSEMQAVVIHRINKYREHLERKTSAWKEKIQGTTGLQLLGESLEGQAAARPKSQSHLNLKPEKPEIGNFILSLVIFAFVSTVWILFFHYYPGEEKPLLEATYMALITLTTVGFGAVTPVTEGGMVFSAFMMFIGTASLVCVVTEFSGYVLELAEWEAWNPKKFQEDLTQFYTNLGHELSEVDFLTFTLVQKKILDKEEIDAIRQAYEELRPKGKHHGKCPKISHIATLGGIERVSPRTPRSESSQQ